MVPCKLLTAPAGISEKRTVPADSLSPFADSPGRGFATTEWSVVLDAGTDGDRKHRALEKLCRTYWRPVYGFIRRLGHPREEARDLTQAFFAHLLDSGFFATADPERGRFRGYLRQSCRYFLGNVWQKQQAEKRGADTAWVPWDELSNDEENQFATTADPSRDFDRQWTYTLLHEALAKLEREYAAAGDAALFAHLRPYLTAKPGPGDYDRLATDLRVARGTVPVLVHRCTKRYQELIRAGVAATVATRAEVDDELRQCLAALAP